MRKSLYTLNVDGYAPPITALTYPLLEHYARKIGAEFHVIDSRRWPKYPVVYEKLQIHNLAAKHGDEWSIYIDSDALVHPETIDFSCFIPKDTVAHNGNDMASIRWRYDRYFMRDGRNIGSCNWNTWASEWCRDLWTPLDIPLEEAVSSIFATPHELNTVIVNDHLIDDYALSRNIARFGLKFTTLTEVQKRLGFGDDTFFFWHLYTDPIDVKVRKMGHVLRVWDLPKHLTPALPPLLELIANEDEEERKRKETDEYERRVAETLMELRIKMGAAERLKLESADAQ